MEFRDALKLLRNELGLTQTELATALHISFSTVGRWENGKTIPNRSLTAALMDFARAKAVSGACLAHLQRSIDRMAKDRLRETGAYVRAAETEAQALMLGQRLDAILEHISNGLVASIIRDDGAVEYLFVTDRIYEMLGYTKEQFHQEVTDPFTLIAPESAAKVRQTSLSLKSVGDTATQRFQIRRRDGGLIWLNETITVVRFADVESPVRLCVFTDVSSEVEANEKLCKQRDYMDEMINTTPSGIAVIEVDSTDVAGSMKTTYYNDRFFSFSGYNREEYDALLNGNQMHFMFEEDIPALMNATEVICAGELGQSADCTVRCHVKDGSYRWLLLTGLLAERRGSICVIHISMVDVTARQAAIDQSRISEEMLRIAAETDRRALIIFDVKANVCRVESHNLYAADYGEAFSPIPQALIERQIVAPDSIAELQALFENVRAGKQRFVSSIQLHTGKNEYQWFECNSNTVLDADGRPDHAVLVFHNITEQRVKEAVFKKWQQSIETRPAASYTLFRCNLNKDTTLDEQNGELLKIRFANESASFNDRTKRYAEAYVYPDDRESYQALLNSSTLLARFYRGEHTATMEYREMTADGELLWRKLTIEMVQYLNSTDIQAFLMYEDIDDAKRTELREKELAESDPLTGALNRSAFSQRVNELIASESSAQHALLMMDMDGFKLINDTFGHAAGDQALIDVTAVLRSVTRSGDIVCRLGGDEFLLWLRDIPYDAVIEKLAKQICEQVRKAFSTEVQISASVGVAVYPRDGRNVDDLYRNADKALYAVKQSGKDGYAFFSTASHGALPEMERPSTKATSVTLSAKPNRRLLIVDDSEANRLLLSKIFADDYLVDTAKNGTEAMVRLRHFGTAISAVLLDLVMPGMDGFAVLRRMQDSLDLRTIPVIVVSGNTDRETLLKAIGYGAADYVTKPIDRELLRLRVTSAISKAENERLRAQNSYLQLQRDEEMKFQTVLESTGTVVIEYDWRNHVFVYDKDISKYIAGTYDHRGLWTVFLSDMVASITDVKALQEQLLTLANDRANHKTNRLVMLLTPERKKHWFRVNIYKREDAYGLAEKMIITFNDVHEEVLANEKLRYQATRDELTGLYNRAGFIEEAEKRIAAHEPGYYVMSCIDIEKFKVINDQYGSAKGDEVLRMFAGTLTRMNDPEDSVCCRIMADNFAVLYPKRITGSPTLEDAHREAEKLDGSLPPLRFYIGRYIVSDKSMPISAIYDRASIAKNTVKGRYDEYIATYDESMRTSLLRQQEITGQMNSALDSGQFEVWLQPQFNHATGMLSGAEALVRWRHPKDGIISPAEFIPIFEQNGFVYKVDQFVWEQTCRLLRKWLDQGLNPVPVSVNISRYDVFRDDLIDIIKGLVHKYDLPVGLLRLEITESAFSKSTDQIIRVVKEFVGLGFIVEIDDFGSGYSSLNTLKDVPAQVLKMDMRFLENDSNAQRGGSIIESVVRMARWLGMSVIAEGVETLEQADYLKSIGCEYVQGYLYARPTQIAEYERLFAAGRTESRLGKLKTVDTWNNNAFWNPKSIETLIFNSYVGGACIFEYARGKTELLRYNDSYAEILGHYYDYNYTTIHSDIFSAIDAENAAKLKQNIENAIVTKKESVCEIRLPARTSNAPYIRATVRQIAQAGDRSLFYCVITDTTAQREAERAEREIASRIAAIMDNVDGGITAVSIQDGKPEMVFSNDRFYSQLGYTREQFQSEMPIYFMAIHPDDRRRVWEKVAETLRSKEPSHIDYRSVKRDGSIIYLRSNLAVCQIDGIDGDVMITVETDVSELVAEQQKNARTTGQLQAIMDHINGGVAASVVQDGKIRYLFANDRYYELLGYTKPEYEEHFAGVFDTIHPEDRERTQAIIRQSTQDLKPYNVEFRVVHRDGKIRWLQCNITIVSLPDVDEPVHLAAVSDTTALHEARQKEIAAAKRIHTVMDNASCGITAVVMHPDKTAEYLLVNDKYYDLVGYTRQQYIDAGSPGLALMHPDDLREYEKRIVALNAIGQTLTFEFRARRRDGSWIWLRDDIAVISIDSVNKPVQLSCFTDITARKEADERLRFVNLLAREILSQPDNDQAIHGILRHLLAYSNAERCYIVELDAEHATASSTYEVCAEGAVSKKAKIQNVAFHQSFDWYTTLAERNVFRETELDRLKDERLRELLSDEGVHSIVLAPLWKDGDLIGFAGLDNPACRTSQFDRLTAPSDYLTILLSRRNLEKQLLDANASRLELLDNLPSGAALYRYDGETLSAVHINKRYWELVEREPIDYSQASVLAMIHPDDVGVIKREIDAAIRQHRDATVDFRVRRGTSGYKAFHVAATITQTDDGSYLLYTTYMPISEKAMSMQEMLPIALSTMMSASDDYSYVKDSELRYICCSRSDAMIMGFKDERDFIGKTDYELFSRELADQFSAQDRLLLQNGKPIIDHPEKHRLRDGSVITVSASKYPITDASGSVVGIYGIARNITEQRKKESQLELLTESIPGGLATYECSDAKIRIVYHNNGFCELFGVSSQEYDAYTADDPLAYVFEEDKPVLMAQYHALMHSDTPIDCVYRIRMQTGGLRWVHHRAVVADRHDEIVVVNAALFDITERQEEREQLRLAEEEYRLATEHSKATTCRFHVASRTLTLTSQAAKRLDLPEVMEDMPYSRVRLGRISPDTTQAYIDFYEGIIQGKEESSVIFQKLLPNGWRWISMHETTMFSGSGKPISAVISCVDVTEQQEKEAVYRKWQQRLSDKGADAYTLFRCNLNKNRSFDTIEGTLIPFELPQDESLSFNDITKIFAKRWVYLDDQEKYTSFVDSDKMLASYHRGKRAAELDYRGIISSGETHWLRLSVELVEYPNSSDVEAYLMYEDINDSALQELQAKLDAQTDPLTGLLNRNAFTERIGQQLAVPKPGLLNALLMLDMDGFKLVNDTYGHVAGDQVLIDAGKAIRSILRENDLVCRLGGDEFMVCLTDMPNRGSILNKAKQLCRLTHRAFHLDVRMSVSIGIALSPDDGDAFDVLYQKADKALYYVKEHGKDSCAFFSEDMSRSLGEHDDWLAQSSEGLDTSSKRRMLIAQAQAESSAKLEELFRNDFIIDMVDNGTDALIHLRRNAADTSIVLLDLSIPELDGFDVLDKMRDSAELQAIPVIVVNGLENREIGLRAIRNGATDYMLSPIDDELLRVRVASAVSKAENERLLLQNQSLKAQQFESERVRAILEADGTVIAEYNPVSGSFRYEAAMSRFIAGQFDDRPLWEILRQDSGMSQQDAEKLQAMVNDGNGTDSVKTVLRFRTPSGETHSFRVKTIAGARTLSAGQDMLLVITDLDLF